MTDDVRPPLSRRLLMRLMPRVFRVVNVPMRLVLALPISTPLGKRLMLAYLTGRKTGTTTGSRSVTSATGKRCSRPAEDDGNRTWSRVNPHTSSSADATSPCVPSSCASPPRSIAYSES
jgi:hypothetical protein